MRIGQAATSASDLNARRQIGINQSNLSKSLERLSSGMRINRAADDAAGLAVSETIRTQIRGLAQGSANSEDGLNLLNTADGGLQEMQNMLHRVRELVVQGANQTYTDGDREKIQGEISQLLQHIDDISNNTEFNGIKVLRGGTAVQGGAFGYLNTPVLSPTVPGVPGTPTIPFVPTIPAVITPMVPTVVDTVASVYRTIGVQTPPAGVTIAASSLGGLAVDQSGNIYIAGADPVSASLPPAVPHAIIRIDSGGTVDTNFAKTPSTSATGAAIDQATGNLYVTANSASQYQVLEIASAAGVPSGTAVGTTVISQGPFVNAAPFHYDPAIFATGIAVDPSTGLPAFGTSSPLYGPGFSPSSYNNVYSVTDNTPATEPAPMLGPAGVPLPPLPAPGLINQAGLHNTTGIPNNAAESGNPTADNVFIQDLTFDPNVPGQMFFTSRMTAPFEMTSGGSFAGLGPAPQGALFVAKQAPGGGTTITQVHIAANGPTPADPPRLGGMAVDPLTGDLLISVRDDNTIRRISNPGQPGQTETVISVGVPAVGMSFVTNPGNPQYGRLYISTQTASNDIYTLDPPVAMIPTIVVTATVPMVATVPAGAGTPTVPAVFGPTEFIALDGALHIQTGANEAQDIRIKVNNMSASALNLEGMDITRWGNNPYGSVSTDQYVEDVNYDIKRIDDALANISTVRATFGAYYNRLEHSKANVDNARENQSASESRIRDTDMAQEASDLVRQQILTQASTGMLGQIQRINGQIVMGLIQGGGR